MHEQDTANVFRNFIFLRVIFGIISHGKLKKQNSNWSTLFGNPPSRWILSCGILCEYF